MRNDCYLCSLRKEPDAVLIGAFLWLCCQKSRANWNFEGGSLKTVICLKKNFSGIC